MRAHYLQHVPFEGLGSIDSWLQSIRAETTGTRLFEDPTLPAMDDLDLLIIMGGPMSVNDEADFPWLVAEKEFIRAAIEKDKAVIGICLGAQLIANAMGATVRPNKEKEIGWFPITGEATKRRGRLILLPGRNCLCFTGTARPSTCRCRRAIRLARSHACENQAFQLGRRVIGTQFHLETTPASARALAHYCRDELQPSRYVQTEAEMLGIDTSCYSTINRYMDNILQFIVR